MKYPILPEIFDLPSQDDSSHDSHEEIMHIRHHTLFAPRDFDISPYFGVIKPTIDGGFNHRDIHWASQSQLEALQ